MNNFKPLLINNINTNFIKQNVSESRFSKCADIIYFLKETEDNTNVWHKNWEILKSIGNSTNKLLEFSYIDYWLLEIYDLLKSNNLKKNKKNLKKLGVNFKKIFIAKNKLDFFLLYKKKVYIDFNSDYYKYLCNKNFFYQNPKFKAISKKESTRWIKNFDKAAFLLEKVWPSLKRNSQFINYVFPIGDNQPIDNGITFSTSDKNFFGGFCTSFMNVEQASETIVHEFAHNLLEVLLKKNKYVKDKKNTFFYYSAFRKDARPIEGLLHAIYSFVNVCYFLCRLIEYDIRYKKIYYLRYSELLIKTLISFRSIKNSKELTVNGKKFIKNLYSYAKRLKNKHYFKPNVEILNSIEKDYEIWIKKNKKNSLVCKYYTTDFFKKDLKTATFKSKYFKKVGIINDLSSIHLKSFKTKFKSINVPLLIEKQNFFKKNINLTTVKNQLADYSFEFLKLDKHYGHINTPKIKLDFKSFLFSKSKLYLGFINANEKIFVKSLIKDNKFINKFRLNNDEVLIFFNKPNSKISLHFDSGNNIHHTFFGHKKFALIKPEFDMHDHSDKNNINFSSFDPFNTSKKMVDKYKINYIDVKKNESLFIPSGWWHSVLYLKNSFSLSIMDLC